MLRKWNIQVVERHVVGAEFLRVFCDADDLHGGLYRHSAALVRDKLEHFSERVFEAEQSLRGIAIDDGNACRGFAVIEIKVTTGQ